MTSHQGNGAATSAPQTTHTNGHVSGNVSPDRAPKDKPTPASAFAGGFEYAPAPETVKVEIKDRYGHFINGAWTPAKGESFATINPATEKPLAHVSQGSDKDVDAAVKAA
ncbi:MAG TPA: hypothetical protein VHN77_05625, partial [Phycisphaerales bacterium]|nr:hypothetical protein [Phycisphaerales bacterium]